MQDDHENPENNAKNNHGLDSPNNKTKTHDEYMNEAGDDNGDNYFDNVEYWSIIEH